MMSHECQLIQRGARLGRRRGAAVRAGARREPSSHVRRELFQPLFQPVRHPRLQALHEQPDIYSVASLLSGDECQRLIAKARSAGALERQSYDDAGGGARTSRGVVLRNEECAGLRGRFAELAGVQLSQLQPLKVSRYVRGERFDIHTDAIRGNLRGAPPEPDDWFADRARARHGVVGAPFSGANRILTLFVYLNDVSRGGRTRWRWLDHDGSGGAFYVAPGPGAGVTDTENGVGETVASYI